MLSFPTKIEDLVPIMFVISIAFNVFLYFIIKEQEKEIKKWKKTINRTNI